MVVMEFTEYGRPASQLLHRAIAAAKEADPLAAVTVVVPSNFAGLVARRLLGSGELGGTGVANVSFLTGFGLAEHLGAAELTGKLPLTNPVLDAAVRRALSENPHHFARVRDHQATEHAVATAFGELANVSRFGLDAITNSGGLSAGVVDLYHSIRSHLTGFHDEAALARAARNRSDLTEAVARLGRVIWFLPEAVSGPLARLIGAVVAASGDAVVIVARSGVGPADTEIWRTLARAGLDRALGEAGEAPFVPLASEVVSVSDADEEVRQVVRQVIGLVESGVRLDRIGIFHPVPDPYVRLLEQHLAAAEITANGPSRRRSSDAIAGRVLLGALALPDEQWRRDRVTALLSSGPIRHGDGFARSVSWDTISRVAGVVGGRRDWQRKLASRRDRLDRWIADAETAGHDRRVERMRGEQADIDAFAEFLDTLDAAIGAVRNADSWADRSGAALGLLHLLVGPGHRHHHWPEREQAAFDDVESALARLAALDSIDPAPSSAVFERALRNELSASRSRNGRFGNGVVYGPLASAPGHDLDAVFILGCAEGLLPAPRREDALIPDRARLLTNGELPARLGQLHEQHRMFLAAIASAPPERRWLLFPRGDLRSSRRNRPSRWLLPSASALAGRSLFATNFDHETPVGVTEVASHHRAIAETEHAASLPERDLAEVLAFVEADSGNAVDHPAAAADAPAVVRGLQLQQARAGQEFTAFDGNLGEVELPAATDQLWSASRLESWAACGFRYFLGHMLGLGERDDPERLFELSALDRGTAMHEVLERFLREVTEAAPQDPNTPWSAEQRARALAIADEVFDDLEGRGRTGRSLLWQVQQRELRSLIADFLDADDLHRVVNQAVPARFEQAFGTDGEPAVEIDLADGRDLRFRGFIDRIDVAPHGRMLVSDYKTGSGSKYRRIDSNDPTEGGELLQLGLYAEAAHQLLGAQAVDTRYWMVNAKANYDRLGYDWLPEHRNRLRQVLTTIVEGIESGVFIAAPGDWNSFRRTYEQCSFCEFDRVCPRDRAEHAADKAEAPGVAVRLQLKADVVADSEAGQ